MSMRVNTDAALASAWRRNKSSEPKGVPTATMRKGEVAYATAPFAEVEGYVAHA